MKEMEFPITVNKIKFDESETLVDGFGAKCGDLVSIRPCAKEHKNKTFLGIYIGDIALAQSVTLSKDKQLTVHRTRHNPAIFVPDLNKVIYGCESWWGQIEDEESLREITDDDINNIWYVKALKRMSETEPETTNQ